MFWLFEFLVLVQVLSDGAAHRLFFQDVHKTMTLFNIAWFVVNTLWLMQREQTGEVPVYRTTDISVSDEQLIIQHKKTSKTT